MLLFKSQDVLEEEVTMVEGEKSPASGRNWKRESSSVDNYTPA
jgi:hypothetical protein